MPNFFNNNGMGQNNNMRYNNNSHHQQYRNTRPRRNRTTSISIAAIIMLLVGIGIILISVVFLGDSADHKNAISTNAEVISFEKTYNYGSSSSSRYNFDVKVKYTVDGKEYEGLLAGYSTQTLNYETTMFYEGQEVTGVGQTIQIKYSSTDPSKIVPPSTSVLQVVLIIVGAVMIAGCSVWLFFAIKKSFVSASCKKNGTKICASVYEFNVNRNTSVNYKNPAYIVCKYEDKFYKSKKFYVDNFFVEVGTPVDVYINESNPDKYHVDIDSLIKNTREMDFNNRVAPFNNSTNQSQPNYYPHNSDNLNNNDPFGNDNN